MGALLFTGCARSPQAQRDKHLTAGKQLLEKKDYRRAILEFQNAVQSMPADAEARYELGLALAESGDVQRGYNNLKRALELDPKHQQAQLRVAQLMASARDRELVKQGQEELKKLAGSTRTPDVLDALALTQLKLGETGDAITSLEESLKTSPGDLGSSIMLAIAKLSQKDIAGAEDVLKKACESSPKSADPHVVLGEFYARQRRGPEAEAEFQKALRIDPKKYPALLDLARVQNSAGEKQQAEENFKRLANSGEQPYKPMHALFLFDNGRQNEAIAELETLFARDPSDRGARTRLVAAYEMTHRTADAEKILGQALKKEPRDTEALTQRAALFQASGKYAEAEKDLNEVLHLQPDSAEAHYTLAKIHKAQGQALSERQDLSETVRLNPNFVAGRIELAELLASGKDKKAALDLIDQAPPNQRQTPLLMAERNWVLWGMGNLSEMRKGIDQGLAKGKTSDLLIQDGLWKLRTGNVPGARAALEEALQIAPDVRALEGLYSSYAANKAAPAGFEKVKEYASRQPKSAPIQVYLGILYLQNGDREKARAAFNAAKAGDPQYVKADFALVQVDVLEGKLGDAQKRLDTILAANDHSSVAHLWLGIVEQAQGHQAVALQEFRKSLDLDAQNPQALNNLAFLLSDYANKPDEALPYAEKARELAPKQAEYAGTLGWIFYQKGLYETAVTQLAAADSMKQRDPIMKYHLAMAYAKAGDVKRGHETLAAALKLNPNLPEAKLAATVVEKAK